MSSVDDRIVNMQFNNKDFESGISQSQRSLQGLETSLANTAKSKGLTGLAASVDGVKHRFGAMQVAGVAAVATIASKATSAGLNLIKSLTIAPMIQGWQEYNTNLTSIQTVMANTGKSIQPVMNALNQLNHYSDQTIYNFSQMAKNVGTFTAAGVKLKTSVAAIQGISNMAALSGSSAEQASMAMYQLSQAIAAGRVNLQDWNSVVNAGMGGKNLQRALIQTGVAMGTVSEKAVQLGDKIKVSGKSFRESISAKPGQAAWLTSDVLVKTLSLMDGRLSKSAITANIMAKGQHTLAEATVIADTKLKEQQATLKKQGFNKEQIKNLTSMANRAYESATVVKTLPQLLNVVQESIGSVWSTAFTGIVGNFNQSKKLWTSASNSISNVVKGINYGMTNMIVGFNRAGGRIALITGLKMAFKSLGAIIGTMKDAFRDVFPPGAGKGIANITIAFRDLMIRLTPQQSVLDALRKTFGGVFAVLHIGFTVVKALAAGFGAFFGAISQGSGGASGGILKFVGHVGELLMELDKFLTSGGKMIDLFRNIGRVGGGFASQGISIASGIIMGLINGMTGSLDQIQGTIVTIATQIVAWFKDTLGIHSPATELVPVGTNIMAGIGQGISAAIGALGTLIAKAVGEVIGFFSSGLGNMDSLDWVTLMNTIFTGALLLSIRSFFKNMSKIGSSVVGTFNQLTSTLKSMQREVQAKMLMKIAIAVGILTASLIALSLLKVEQIQVGIGALAAMTAVLVGALAGLSKVAGDGLKKSIGLTALSGAMVAMATAMLILSGAVAILGNMDMTTLEKGIGSLAVVMGIMVGATAALAKMGPASKGAAGGMVLMAVAMNILVSAIALLGNMDVGTLAKGIGAMAFMMGIMVGALLVLSKAGKAALQGAGAILIVSAAMTALAATVFAFGSMDIKTLAKGFGALAIGLGLMVGALMLMAAEAPGILIVSQAMALMSAAMIGLAVAVGMFGSMDAGTLAKGFIAVALGLTLLLVAAAAAIPLAPGLAILSETFLALGGALALAGLGMMALATGFGILAVVGTAGVAVLTVAFQAFMALLPALGMQLAAAFVVFVQTIAAASNKLRPAFDTIFKNMVGVVTDNIPVIAGLMQKLISTAIGIIKKSVPQWVEMGFTIIDKFIKSAAKHVPDMVDNALKLVRGFMDAISKNLGPLADSAAKMIISFINAVSTAINDNASKLGEAGVKLAGAIVNGMTGGLAGKGLEAVKKAAQKIADALPGWMKKVLGIHSPSKVTAEIGYRTGQGLAVGIGSAIPLAVAAAVSMANAIIAAGDQSVARVQAWANSQQRNADAAQANADVAKQAANKVNPKKNPKLAKKLKKRADSAQNAADAAQAQADAAAQQVQDARDFASADNVGKGDIVDSRAVDLANQASKMLAKANAEAVAARSLRGKAAKAMLAQAQRDAQSAKTLSDNALAANREANSYYAKEVQKRLDDMQAEEDAKKAQAEYDTADTQGKMDILKKRADAAQAKADSKYAEAAALVERAKALAATDAAGALRLLDQADALRQDAKDAADAAKQAQDQAAQLAGEVAGGGGVGGGNGPTMQPSRSVLDDAASVVDSYTASLEAAQQAAGATQQLVQFVQTNNSPVALTASEVYRQTKNLLSATEIKMGATSN